MRRKGYASFAEFEELCEALQCSKSAYATWAGFSPHSPTNWGQKGQVPFYALLPGRAALGETIGTPTKWKRFSRPLKEPRVPRPLRERVDRGAPFAPRNAEICRLLREGLSLESIGKQFGITRERVRQIGERFGLKSLTRVKYAENRAIKAESRRRRAEAKREIKAHCLQLISEGHSAAAAALQSGAHHEDALLWARESGISPRRGPKPGSARKRCSYDRELITQLASGGANQSQIARAVGAPSRTALINWCRYHEVPLSARSAEVAA